MSNVLLDEIEKRRKNIAEHNDNIEIVAELKEKIAELENKVASLESEIASINIDVLQEEIDYLTAVAIREGVLEAEVSTPDEGVNETSI
ncbi:MAG: hypothetical protein ACI4MS_07695 [Candidatus Coproplasma sp.]